MKHFIKTLIKRTIFIVALSVFTITLSAQESNEQAFEKAKKEITETFGTFPLMFDAFPKYALPGAWQSFKELQGPGNIDAKNRELIGLAVASQIPCAYCVYYHTASAKAMGATDEEIKEAVAYSALVRHWSTVVHGAQADLEEFKKGTYSMFDSFPKYALSGARQAYKELRGPGSIEAKNRELIGLAVSSQIPCTYCVWSHVTSLKEIGATDEEIKEAVAQGAMIRHWSTIVHGAQIDLEDFKKEFQGMMEYMAEKAKTQ